MFYTVAESVEYALQIQTTFSSDIKFWRRCYSVIYYNI